MSKEFTLRRKIQFLGRVSESQGASSDLRVPTLTTLRVDSS